MKKAVIQTGNKQYLVQEGETIAVELVHSDKKSFTLEPLLVIDGEKTSVGKPNLSGVNVKLEVVDPDVMADKVTAVRFKAKKRVHKVHGHRQHQTLVKVVSIA